MEEEHRVAHMYDAKLQGLKHMVFHNPEEFWHLLCQYLNPTALVKQIEAVPAELSGVRVHNININKADRGSARRTEWGKCPQH